MRTYLTAVRPEEPIGVGRRKTSVANSTGEKEYSPDEMEFIVAMDRFIRDRHRPFPTWTEALTVLKSLGYAKPTSSRS